MTNEEQGRDLFELIIVGGLGAILAMAFQAVCLARRDSGGNPISWRQVAVELCGAGAVGAMAAWALQAFSVNHELAAVFIAMSGYVGGPLLDVAYKELIETFKAAFAGIKKYLEAAGWKK